jgi:RHS repeat-associated protein
MMKIKFKYIVLSCKLRTAGNVRVTFTTKEEVDHYFAGFEDADAQEEQALFSPSYDNAVRVNATLYNHTPVGSKSQRLSAANVNETVGLAKSLQVMPGDTIQAEVYVKYFTPSNNNSNVSGFFLDALTTAFGLSANVPGEAGYAYMALEEMSLANLLFTSQRDDVDDNAPHAYLNYILFDNEFIPYNFGFKQVSTSALETGSGVPHQRLFFEGNDIVVTRPGYIYIYLSNENAKIVDVYFDDLSITHTKSPVIQAQDYYPFGLTFNSYQRENSLYNKYQYNGKEIQNELGLGWNDYGARMYMSDIGRWGVIDAKSEEYISTSPYVYALNTPINAIDPDGQRVYFVAGAGNDKIGWNYTEKWRRAFTNGGIQGFTPLNVSYGGRSDIAYTITHSEDPLGRYSGRYGTLEQPDSRVDNAVNSIRSDLSENPLAEGEQLNMIGYSYGSVVQARAALKLANEGQYVDNLILVGSTISSNSRLFKRLQKNENIGNVLRRDIEGDKLSDPKDILSFLQGGMQNSDPNNTGESPHFDLARPGKGEGDNNDTYKRIQQVVVEWLKQQGVK